MPEDYPGRTRFRRVPVLACLTVALTLLLVPILHHHAASDNGQAERSCTLCPVMTGAETGGVTPPLFVPPPTAWVGVPSERDRELAQTSLPHEGRAPPLTAS